MSARPDSDIAAGTLAEMTMSTRKGNKKKSVIRQNFRALLDADVKRAREPSRAPSNVLETFASLRCSGQPATVENQFNERLSWLESAVKSPGLQKFLGAKLYARGRLGGHCAAADEPERTCEGCGHVPRTAPHLQARICGVGQDSRGVASRMRCWRCDRRRGEGSCDPQTGFYARVRKGVQKPKQRQISMNRPKTTLSCEPTDPARFHDAKEKAPATHRYVD
jgi:hypothetical protein